MSMIDTGTYGAKVQSWRAANPRDLLKRIIEENPGSDRPGLLSVFADRIWEEGSEEYIESIIEYWFSNNYQSLVTPPVTRATATAKATAVGEIVVRLNQKIGDAAKIVLMSMELPNGKMLRDCTGRECKEMGPRIGAWLTRVADQVGPRQTVGDVMTEEMLGALYRGR